MTDDSTPRPTSWNPDAYPPVNQPAKDPPPPEAPAPISDNHYGQAWTPPVTMLPSAAGRGATRRALALVALASMLLGGLAGGAAGFAAGRLGSAPPVAVPAPSAPEGGVTARSAPPLKGASSLAAQVIKRAAPAVVTVINSQQAQDVFGNDSTTLSTGSGVIIDREGHILTNNHVIRGYTKLEVIFANGDRKLPATLIGADPDSDLAVIKVDVPVPGWAPLGDSSQVQPGDPVLAIGSALGDFHNTVTQGIISGLNRTLTETDDDGTVHNLTGVLQTDAAINHGNSGGPLLDLNGYVVGINTAVVRSTNSASGANPFTGVPGLSSSSADTAEGLGFAIASNTAKSVAQRLLLRLPEGYLGVDSRPLTPQIAAYLNVPRGAYVLGVKADSPAAAAGLQPRDVITKVNGQIVDENHPLPRIVRAFKPGDKATITLSRGGRSLTVTVTLTTRPANVQ